MSTKIRNSREDLLFYFVKCGSMVLLACLLLGLLLTYASEVFEAICASIRWSSTTFIVAKDAFYVGFTHWSWLPPTVVAVCVAAYFWVACVCAAMKKKYFLSQVHYRLDMAKTWVMSLSILALILYVPLSKEPDVVMFALSYGIFNLLLRLLEMDRNAIAARSLSKKE